MSNLTECHVDADCKDNELCYIGTSWYENQLPWQSNSSFRPGCACNAFYAWSGDNCDELTAATYVFVIIAAINALVLLVSIYLLSRSVWLLYKRDNNTCVLNAGMFTAITTIPGALGLLVWNLTTTGVGSALKRTGPFYSRDEFASSDPYKGRFNQLGFLAAGVGYILVTLAAIMISLMWLEIADMINESRLSDKTDRLKKYRNFTLAFIVCYGVTLMTSAFVERRKNTKQFHGLVVVPFNSVVLVVYAIGAYKFTQILAESSRRVSRKLSFPPTVQVTASPKVISTENDSKDSSLPGEFKFSLGEEKRKRKSQPFKKRKRSSSGKTVMPYSLRGVIRRVRNTTIQISVSIFVGLVAGMIMSLYDIVDTKGDIIDGMREKVNPDNPFGMPKVCYILVECALTSTSIFIAFYLFSNSSGRSIK
uniref:Uncharacterized protein n=1 Tax=Aplanochytrium stocchinoi TaxID=215587 RepID=A0A7S3V079_9STRA|mmetsp:Transcript_993/g.1290  ORF Transcript_993/g.1290 Transcript_993/m.1290 type:complete len:422 (+) Transcript_993:136-1401(+)